MTVNRISEHNTPVVEARIAPAVFLLCPFNKSKVTAVDNTAVRILVQTGDHPEKTAGSRNSMMINMEYRSPARDFRPLLPLIHMIAAMRIAAQAAMEKRRS